MSSETNCTVGAYVPLPDGRHAWEVPVSSAPDLGALVTFVTAQVLPDSVLSATVTHGELPSDGSLTVTLVPHLGGGSVQVFRQAGAAGFTLLFEAVVSTGAVLPEPVVTAPAGRSGSPMEELPGIVESFGGKWDSSSGQSLEERLGLIVAESMGYAVEDLPAEIPLIELGLDSLMAVRIKNRVEYEFDIPQLQLQAVRDASLREMEKYLRYAIDNREELEALAESQRLEKGSVPAPAALPAETEAPAGVPRPAPAERSDVDVPPRDAAERLTFASWAVVTGKSAKGIFNTLPVLDDDTAQKLAARLSERAGGEVTFDDILDSETIEQLAEKVREHLEDGVKIDGLVRTLRARPEGSSAVPVFVFHPAGGSTVAYEPLLKRLPADTPMYGFERTEGSLEARAKAYLPLVREIQGDGPYVLYGWSFGGALAYAVAKLLRDEGADVRIVGLIDTVMPGEKVEDTPEEIRKRWERYAAFAKKTYNLDYPLPYDKLAAAESDEAQIQILMDLLTMSGTKIPGGIIEHQRTSWLEYRAIQTADLATYDGDVVLYMTDSYQDDLMIIEPTFRTRQPDGGWGEAVRNLEIIHVGGDHIQIIDEPRVGVVAEDLMKKLALIEVDQ
ncbi:polyketide synthase 13 [Rhodococcus maanshanensis]|uniref:Polyketide synthase 13 n=1 Tax=Rhodococcus maanshanensis TaxID=183556 RepID=A0A1H7Y891_9NOCA|nr:polyketide synthase 13 [Rhodococcus maanshanensis]